MLKLIEIYHAGGPVYASATLTLEQRLRSRQKVQLDNGETAGLFLERGKILQHGDRLRAESGEVVEVRAAEEAVSTLYVDDPLQLARASYHLGNRHVPLQIGAGFLRYQHDHVLDEMLATMGLHVISEQARFEPEAGAYQGSNHAHGDAHHHGQNHVH
jgi:urease accessory protein